MASILSDRDGRVSGDLECFGMSEPTKCDSQDKDSKLLFRRIKVGGCVEVCGVRLKIEWASTGRVMLSTPNVGGAKFRTIGRVEQLTFAFDRAQ